MADLFDTIERDANEFLATRPESTVIVGVTRDGDREVKAFRSPDAQFAPLPTETSIYEIGSISKVFTTTILAVLEQRGVLSLDDPVSKFLPNGNALKPEIGAITIRQLATHSSGLPSMGKKHTEIAASETMGQFQPPFGAYTHYLRYNKECLYSDWEDAEFVYPTGEGWLYCVMGMGTVGHVLELATGAKFEDLLREIVCTPLGLADTGYDLSLEQVARIQRAYDHEGSPQPSWFHDVLMPQGGLRSTTNDLLTFAEAHFAEDGPLVDAMRRTRESHFHLSADKLEAPSEAPWFGGDVDHGLAWRRFGDASVWHPGDDAVLPLRSCHRSGHEDRRFDAHHQPPDARRHRSAHQSVPQLVQGGVRLMALPKLYPVETFFADPEFAGASISPDGTRIAYLAPVAGPSGVERLQVWVRDRDAEHADAVPVTHDFNRGVKSYQWTDDPRWMLFTQDYEGNEDHHLYRIDLDDPSFPAVDLTPMDPGSRVMGYAPFKAKPGSYIVSMNKRPAFVESFEVVIATGQTTCLRENETLLGSYAIGPNGELFWAGLADDESNDWVFEAVDAETDERRTVYRLPGNEMPMGAVPQEITPDGTGVVVAACPEGSDNLALVRYDVATGEQTIVAAVAGHDVCTAHYVAEWFPPMIYKSRATGEIIAVRFFGPRPIIHVIDPEFQPIYDKIAAIAPDSVVSAMSSDKSLRYWVVSFANDREPDVTYLYDHETGESRVLFRPYPAIDPADMASMEYVSIEARDGLPIPCFLTLPVGIEAKNLPLVLHIHGGPWFHDIWCFDRETQFFANRGYAVLQVNFRGSSGQGKRHLNAAKHEFAGKMHDDLIDVAEWAVKQGIADRDSVAMFGGSYGGYAGLVAATFTPGFFAAICAYMGIGSLKNFITSLPLFLRKQISNNWIEYVGDPDVPEQLADMESRSPINLVDRVTTPMLIVQGAHDARVKQSEADEFVAGARAAGADVDYLLFPDEGHAFRKVENIVEMCKRVDTLFAKHLGGRSS